MRLEVRCCCQPQKLLGWVHVDERQVCAGMTIRLLIPPVRRWAMGPDDHVEPGSVLELPVAVFSEGGREWHLALKAEETPIEVLRRIRMFEENR